LVELETINLLVQIVGVSSAAIATVLGVSSYINSSKRAEEAKKREQETRDRELETRQAQLLMQIFDRVSNKDFTRDWGRQTTSGSGQTTRTTGRNMGRIPRSTPS
jgi:hypothetical protein